MLIALLLIVAAVLLAILSRIKVAGHADSVCSWMDKKRSWWRIG